MRRIKGPLGCQIDSRVLVEFLKLDNYKKALAIYKTYGIREMIERWKACLPPERESLGTTSIPDCTIEPPDKFSVPRFANPEVAIIIPAYNKYALTVNCIKSIVNHRCSTQYKIIVVDDHSSDRTKAIEDYISNITVIHNEGNLGFLRSCNRGAGYAESKYLLFLNNDTHVCDDWLDSLYDYAEGHDDVGIVGSKFLYPDTSVQEAGGILWSDGSGHSYGRKLGYRDHRVNYVKEVDYISGASILVPRSLFADVGGFDEMYVPAYCEDSDLAMRMRDRGLKVVYDYRSMLYHFERMSHGSEGLKSYQEANNIKLKERWNDVLLRDHCADESMMFYARDRSLGKISVLFIVKSIPMYDDDARDRMVYDRIRCLLSLDCNVKMLVNRFKEDRYSEMFKVMGVEIIYGYHEGDLGKSWITENGAYIDYVMLFHAEMADFYLDALRDGTGARIYFNVVDHPRQCAEGGHGTTGVAIPPSESEYFETKEIDAVSKYAKIVVSGSIEYDILSKSLSEERVMLAPMCCYPVADIGERAQPKPKSLMFVGDFSHGRNVDAMLYFIKDIWPRIKRMKPRVKLYIIGPHAPRSITSLGGRRVTFCGRVSNDELGEHYRAHSISIVPLRYGAGVKGKVIEAMHHKIPIVSTSVGLEGIEDLSPMLRPKDTPEEFADEIMSLLSDDERSKRMGESYIDCIRKHYTMDAMKGLFSKELGLKVGGGQDR